MKPHHRTLVMQAIKMRASSALPAIALLLASPALLAQQKETAADSAVTVVTLYSESRPAPGSLQKQEAPVRPPISVVDGGVKSAGDSCWKLSDTGQLTTVAGDCFVLRSAGPGEHPPASN